MSDPHQTHDPHLYEVSTGPSIGILAGDHQELTVIPDLEPLLERLTAAFIALDHSWRVTYLSHLSDPLLAQAKAALLGKILWEVFPKAADSPFFHKYHNALEASLPVHCEEYYPPLHKWFEVHISPAPKGWEVYVQEITERKRAEKACYGLAAIIESSDDAIFSKTLSGIISSWNSGAERLYGYSASEIIGQPISKLVPSDRQQEWQEFMRLLQAGERVEHFETVRIRKDGSPVEVSVTLSPVKDANGQIIAASAIAHDITQQKQYERQLHQSKLLQAIIDGSPTSIYVRDLHGRFTHVNQQAANTLHISKEQMLGKTADDLFPREVALTYQAHNREVIATGRAGEWEELALEEDGWHTYLSVKFPLFDADGVPYAVCGISTDISDRKLGQRKDEFISMASHELKTPLTSLLAYTDLLRLLLERDGNQQAIQCLSKMDAQLEKLTRLIADLLDISKVQAGKLAYEEELMVIDDVVREVVENVQLTAPQHRIVIEGTATCEIVGDKDRLEQVILNLLSNAIKYSPQAQTVVVSMTSTSEEIIVSVQDFGIGVPSHSQERIFERFYRGSSNMEKRFSGLGIGLYIAQEIIRHHGGRIWVESVEGQGSTFSFALPLKRG